MDSDAERRKAQWFIGVLALVALLINSFFLGRDRPSALLPQSASAYTAQGTQRQEIEDKAAAARKAAEEEKAQHQKFLERYLNPASYTRKTGITPIAIASVAERGGFNRALAASIAARLKGESTEVFSAVFTPEFISDGLFSHACTGASQVFARLELAK